jgi:2-polyprenyl-3-methyl-5-hydroxy-6-metoxy-1,4-benzoquinol methylase
MASNLRWRIAQYAERRWWKNYLKKKSVPEYLAWKKKYWQDLLSKCSPELEIPSNASILDAGCGPAGIFIAMPNDVSTSAFDPLLDNYETDLPHFKKEMYPSVQFITSDIENFSSEKKYDIIFCMNAINHVQDIEKAYSVLCDALAPKGKMIITIDAHNHEFLKKIFKALPGDILHPHQYNLQEYENFLTQRGLVMQKTIHLKHEFFFDHYLQIAQKS